MSILRAVLIVAGLMSMAAAAHGQFVFKTEVAAIELSPRNIILPTTAGGMMSFRPCDGDCDAPYERVSLGPGTAFSLNGQRMKFDDFRKAMNTTRFTEVSYALINFDVDTKIATNIEVLP